MNTMKTMMAVGAFALAAGNVQATPLSALLGLNKPEIDLPDAEVDTLSKYQVEHFAMGYGAPVTVYTSSAKSRRAMQPGASNDPGLDWGGGVGCRHHRISAHAEQFRGQPTSRAGSDGGADRCGPVGCPASTATCQGR